MTTQLAPTPVFKAFDNNGNPLASGQLFTYIAGTSTPQATWVDSTQTTQNTNPVILNARGEAQVWLDPTLTYKFVLTDSQGNQIWTVDNISGALNPATSIIPSVDNLYTLGNASFSWANLYLGPGNATAFDPVSGNIGYYARTAIEIAANVTPVNFSYPPGRVDRYGTNSNPGSIDMTAAFQASINQARKGGADVTWGDTAPYLLGTGALDCTFSGATQQFGLNFRQLSTPAVNFPTSLAGGIYVTHTDYTVFDLTGCSHFTFYDLSLVTANSDTCPKTCFLTARNSSNESNLPRFYNTTVSGHFSTALFYNYGSEDGVYVGNYWNNFYHQASAKCVVITSKNNVLAGNGPGGIGMASSFVTIATGSQSTIDHQFIGGQYVLGNPGGSVADVFYLDNCSNVKIYGAWLAALNARSYFYCELTNGPAGLIKLTSVQGEVGAAPQYGVLIPNAAGTATEWVLQDVFWEVNLFSLAAAGSTPVVDSFRVIGLQEQSTKGISIPGTLQNSTIDYGGIITVGTSTSNLIIGAFSNFTGSRVTDIFIDKLAGNISAKGSVSMGGNGSFGTLTGWGSPTAGAVINNFPGSGASTSQCGQAITEIIIQLKAAGIFGA